MSNLARANWNIGQGFFFAAVEMALLIGDSGQVHGGPSCKCRQLLSFLKSEVDPGGIVVDFPETRQTHMLAGILAGELGF